MDEVLHELRTLNARFDAFEANINKRLDAIDTELKTIMALVVANNEDIKKNRKEIQSVRKLVDDNSIALQRIEKKFQLKIDQIDANVHEIERLT